MLSVSLTRQGNNFLVHTKDDNYNKSFNIYSNSENNPHHSYNSDEDRWIISLESLSDLFFSADKQ